MSETAYKPLGVPVLLWLRMLRDLRRRGHGARESGAFLLGKRWARGSTVEKYIPYDELDPHALDTGIVVVRPIGFMRLWQECKRLKLQVLADVHTHGGDDPHQSTSDRTNPMISQSGHIAFILPRFAATLGWKFHNVAIYEYLGGSQWKDLRGAGRAKHVRFSWW